VEPLDDLLPLVMTSWSFDTAEEPLADLAPLADVDCETPKIALDCRPAYPLDDTLVE
jgi:hypothetical protein